MAFSFNDFKARFPELSTTDEGFYNEAKKSALLSVNTTIWGAKSDEGIKLMIAHIVELSGRSGNSGQLTREKVGKLEREFKSSGGSNPESTSYLSEFNRLKKCLIISPVFIC